MNSRKRAALWLTCALPLISLAAQGQTSIPQSVIDKCMRAADFQGCVNVMTGKSSAPAETKITVDLDKIRNTGNACPSSFAYIGGGYCQAVGCFYNPKGHDYRLGGKGWSCSGGYTMQFKGEPIRATTDERCPLVEPELGKNNSCTNGLSEAEIKAGKFIKRYSGGKIENSLGLSVDWDRQANKIKVIVAPKDCQAFKSGVSSGDYIVSINDSPFPGEPQAAAEFFKKNMAVEVPIKLGILSGGLPQSIMIKQRSECTFPETSAPY